MTRVEPADHVRGLQTAVRHLIECHERRTHDPRRSTGLELSVHGLSPADFDQRINQRMLQRAVRRRFRCTRHRKLNLTEPPQRRVQRSDRPPIPEPPQRFRCYPRVRNIFRSQKKQ